VRALRNGSACFVVPTTASRKKFGRLWIAAGKTTAVTIAALILMSAKPALSQTWPQTSFGQPIDGFVHPTHLTSARDGSGRLFVVEQPGRIRIIKNGALLATPFLDITAGLGNVTGSKGLLSVAFPPDFASKQHFYVNYVVSPAGCDVGCDGIVVVARYFVTANPDVADANSEQILLTEEPFLDHWGGELAFGPLDGYLYFGIGTGSAASPDALGQDISVLRGKILRIDVETGNPATYTIPPSNPYKNTANARGEIWALGVRNPWSSSFDRQTGDFYIADVGQSTHEEVDFQPAGGPGGFNYGWNIMEGSLCFSPPTGCDTTGLVLPVVEYDHSLGCSITGGTVYRSTRYPSFQGIYFYGDWCSGRLWGLQRTGGSWQSALLYDTTLSIIGFAEDESGRLWISDYNGGAIYPVVEGPPPNVDLSLRQSDSSDPCAAGTQLAYTIKVTNNSAPPATGVLVTDTMPTGTTFVSANSSLGNCARSGTTVTCRIPSLAGGTSATITLIVKPTTAGSIANITNLAANEPDTNASNNSSTENTTITASSDLKITVTDGKSSIAAGQKDTYTIKVTNSGPSSVTGAAVTDNFPAIFTAVTFIATSANGASGFTVSGTGNINDTVTLPAGSSVTYKATGKVSFSASGTLSNTVTVAPSNGANDPNSANNTATDTDTITSKADLKVTVNDNKTTAVAGQKNTYTIVVTNTGPSNASGAVITDSFPSRFTGVTYTATQIGGASGFTASGSGNINNAVTMPSGSKITYKATGTISASATGSISDTATVTAPSGVTDPIPSNNSATDTDTL
jgi:uncharacterized repeat protein (TIGR01451 family)